MCWEHEIIGKKNRTINDNQYSLGNHCSPVSTLLSYNYRLGGVQVGRRAS